MMYLRCSEISVNFLWPYHSMHAMALKISETIQENKGAYFLALDKK